MPGPVAVPAQASFPNALGLAAGATLPDAGVPASSICSSQDTLIQLQASEMVRMRFTSSDGFQLTGAPLLRGDRDLAAARVTLLNGQSHIFVVGFDHTEMYTP